MIAGKFPRKYCREFFKCQEIHVTYNNLNREKSR